MDESTVSLKHLAGASKQIARRLLTAGENRLELLAVEVQEEREHLLRACVLAPLAVLLSLTGLYAAAGLGLCWRLKVWLRDWQTLSASLDQLRKDRAALEKILL